MIEKNEAGTPGESPETTNSNSWQDPGEIGSTHTPAQAQTPPDIFEDLDAFAVDAGGGIPSERVLLTLHVRRPKPTEWVRAHSELRIRLNVVEDKESKATYLVHGTLLEEVRELISVKPVLLALAVTTNGTAFAWLAPIPADHRANLWHSTGLQALEHATRAWVRVRSDMAGGQYEIRRRCVDDGTAPVWPAEIATPNDLCRFSFNGHGGGDVITDRDHTFLKYLRGES